MGCQAHPVPAGPTRDCSARPWRSSPVAAVTSLVSTSETITHSALHSLSAILRNPDPAAPPFKVSSSFGVNYFLIPVTYGTPSLEERAHVPRVGGHRTAPLHKEDTVMKIVISALLALSVLADITAPASAFDPRKEDAGLRSPL